jgi:hypothetical protein
MRSENTSLEQRGTIVGMEMPFPTQGYIVSIVEKPELIEDETPRARLRGAVEFYNRRNKRTESVFIGLTVFGNAARVIAQYGQVGGQVFVQMNNTFSIGIPKEVNLGKSQLFFDMSANDVRLLRASSKRDGAANSDNSSEEADVEF